MPPLHAVALATLVACAAGCGHPNGGASGQGGREQPVAGGATGGGAPTPAPERGVAGRITSITGRPVEGALVAVRGLGRSPAAVPELAVYSDGEGRYWWDLPRGRWELSVRAEGHRQSAKVVHVRAGQRATLDFRLERAP
jgi:hypothetical protein